MRSGSSREPPPSINLGVASEKPPHVVFKTNRSVCKLPTRNKCTPHSTRRCSIIPFPCDRNQQSTSERYDLNGCESRLNSILILSASSHTVQVQDLPRDRTLHGNPLKPIRKGDSDSFWLTIIVYRASFFSLATRTVRELLVAAQARDREAHPVRLERERSPLG